MPAAGEPGPGTRAGWAPAVMLTLVVVVGAALRIHALDSGLWYDEIVTLLDSVRAPLSTIVTHYPSNNDHPFYSVLAHLAIVVLGEHPWTLRLPALVFGVAALPALYALGAAVGSRFEALSATLLLAVSYHHVWFSQNGRGYTILLFCAVLGTHLLMVGLRDDRRSAYLGNGVVSALGAYTHLTMVIAVLERRTEIGLRRALGARRRHIAAQFLTESLILAVLGRHAGIGAGSAVMSAPSSSRAQARTRSAMDSLNRMMPPGTCHPACRRTPCIEPSRRRHGPSPPSHADLNG